MHTVQNYTTIACNKTDEAFQSANLASRLFEEVGDSLNILLQIKHKIFILKLGETSWGIISAKRVEVSGFANVERPGAFSYNALSHAILFICSQD